MQNVMPLLGSGPDPRVPFVTDGLVRFTPAHANAVFRNCRYERQRDENRAKQHIEALARIMKSGRWLSKTTIHFARLPDGRLIMVDGHHRMLAQAMSGCDVVWSVTIHDCAGMEAVRDLFYCFDTVLRKRSVQNVLDGVSAAENLDLQKQTASALARAVGFIENGMAVPQSTRVYFTPQEKISFMGKWRSEAKIYEDCLSGGVTQNKAKMLGVQVMGVALVTIRADETAAVRFWGGIAKDDGLRRGDPRKTLLDYMRDTHAASSGMTTTAVACARAWASFRSGRDLTMIRVGKSPVVIAGTNVVVKP